jgi:aspartate ammonia-lyase
MENFRKESDLLGELNVPLDAYYGVQTQRAINNLKFQDSFCLHIRILSKGWLL